MGVSTATINDAVTIAGREGTLLAGRYRVLRQLGQGGMGSVWLVEDAQLDNKPFAVKMLPSILVSNRRAYRQLKDEALVAMKLTHPNIVTLRAFEENDGNPFLVMDYIDGQTLDELLAEKGTLAEEEVVRLLNPIAAALDYAHGEGVVHRDVKPSNVMIRTDGHPYVLDFGIAREIQETLTRVTGKLSSGTLLYMSPEQLNGAQPKPPQDVYSFAAMAYECLKGDPPFVRGAIEDQIRNMPPPPLPGVTSGAPSRGSGTLAASVMAGLAKKPEDRPPTCRAVLGGAVPALVTMQPLRRVPSPATVTRPVPSPVAAAHLDADVYLLEVDAKDLLAHDIDKMRISVCPELDASLIKAKRTYRAAASAMARGDAQAAKKLFSEFLGYPAARTTLATTLALQAFESQDWANGMRFRKR